MGGLGSGGSRYGGRCTTSQSCELSTVHLRRQGAFKHAGASSVSVWSCGGERVASIVWRTTMEDGPRLHLSYTYTPARESPRQINEAFYLVATWPHIGGQRWWIGCMCGRRVARLYKAPGAYLFRCRRCYRLTYASQNETREWRAFRRLRKCDTRLDPKGDAVPMDYLDGYTPPSKPKGMRWRTYERLVREAESHALTYQVRSVAAISKFLGFSPFGAA